MPGDACGAAALDKSAAAFLWTAGLQARFFLNKQMRT